MAETEVKEIGCAVMNDLASFANGEIVYPFSTTMNWPAVKNSKVGMKITLDSLVVNLPRYGIRTCLFYETKDLSSFIQAHHMRIT